ncbi:serine/threonine-protein kinase ATM-like [Dorcoceras hygrometricum]|uniref:Serine/threonine-protein kinase ATM-like n=1 Tax=Dorcoceras hygrometricum TaxID=472368 RepID=A0A2Z7AGE7_9LAMI|nr:serine/threonine-protein kinase ATM-like [Dorcoceras hygrometricum]
MACAMIKNQQIATVILNQLLQDSSRSVVELEKKPAATIQQRRKFSSNADFIFSTKLQNPGSSTRNKIFEQKTSPEKFRGNSHAYKPDFTLSVVELEKKPAATIQQRRKFSSNADFIFSTKIQISRRETGFFVQEISPVKIQRDLSRVQAGFHVVTDKLR